MTKRKKLKQINEKNLIRRNSKQLEQIPCRQVSDENKKKRQINEFKMIKSDRIEEL